MKKRNLLFLLPALAMVMAGCDDKAADDKPADNTNTQDNGGGNEGGGATTDVTVAYDFTAATMKQIGYTMLGDIPWKFEGEGKYFGYGTDNGQQFGSSGSPETNMTLSTLAYKDVKVKSVKVNASLASGGEGALSVKLGDTDLQSGEATSVAPTNAATDYTFAGDGAGKIAINITQTTSKAIYVKSITVVYEPGTLYLPAVESVSVASDVTEQDVGKKIKLSASTLPEGSNPNYTFSIASGSEYATLNGNELTGEAAGEVKVVATAANDVASAEYTVKFNAVDAPDYKIDVIKDAASVVGLPTAAAAGADTGTFTVGTDTWNQKRCTFSPNEDASKNYVMFRTKKNTTYGSSDAAALGYVANTVAFTGNVEKVEIDVPSGASASASYGLVVGSAAVTEFAPTAAYTTEKGNNQTFTFNVTEKNVTFIAIGCATTSYNGQFTAIRIYFAK